MLKNHCLAQAIQDVGLYEFRRQLEYKGSWYGCEIVKADRFFQFHHEAIKRKRGASNPQTALRRPQV